MGADQPANRPHSPVEAAAETDAAAYGGDGTGDAGDGADANDDAPTTVTSAGVGGEQRRGSVASEDDPGFFTTADQFEAELQRLALKIADREEMLAECLEEGWDTAAIDRELSKLRGEVRRDISPA